MKKAANNSSKKNSNQPPCYPWSFSYYAKETTKEYKDSDRKAKQFIRFHIVEEINNYQTLLKTFDEIDEAK